MALWRDFKQAMQFFLKNRDSVPLDAFRGAPVRFLLRNTDIYAAMQKRLLETRFLGSAVDRSIELEKLARPFSAIFFARDGRALGGGISLLRGRTDRDGKERQNDAPRTKRFMQGWCSGPAGIGLARMRQSSSFGPVDDADIKVAIDDAINGRPLASKHLCCGETARIELLLHAADLRGENGFREAAHGRAMQIIASSEGESWYVLNGADRGKLFAPSFFQGLSGIGYRYLRILHPTLPAVASFQKP